MVCEEDSQKHSRRGKRDCPKKSLYSMHTTMSFSVLAPQNYKSGTVISC